MVVTHFAIAAIGNPYALGVRIVLKVCLNIPIILMRGEAQVGMKTVSAIGGMSALALALASPQSAIAQSDSNDDILDVIYVTARKRDETQLEIPVSVAAFSQADLDARGINTAETLGDFVPGFTFETTGQGGFSGRTNPSIRFRGIGVQVGSAASRAGALFWDGAYIADGVGVLPLIDLSQTEVIKGPQTAFFGRNTFAGAVNFIPGKASEELEFIINAAGTRTDADEGYNISATVSGPLGDRFRGRVTLSSEDRPGQYEFRDGQTQGDEQTNAIQGSLEFDATENVTLKYSGFYVDSEDTSVLQSISATTPAGECNRTFSGNLRQVGTGAIVGSFETDLSQSTRATFCGSVPEWTDENINPSFFGQRPPEGANVGFFGLGGFDYPRTAPVEMGSVLSPPDGLGNTYEVSRHHLSIDAELASGHNLKAFYSMGDSEFWGIFDQNYGSPGFGDIFYTGFVSNAEDKSAEIRLTSPISSDRFRYSVGLSYFQQDTFLTQFSFGPIPNLIFEEGENFGVFGSIDYDLTDQLTLSVEGRWHDDTQTQLRNGPQNVPADRREQQYDDFMPRLILSYQPADLDMNIYGSVSKSFLQGNPTGAEAYAAFVPEGGIDASTVGFFTPVQELLAFELGIKQRVNDRFSYAAAVYNMDWDNQVFFDLSPAPIFASVFLPGDSEYTGIELEGVFNVNDSIVLSGGFTYVDAELTSFGLAGSIAGAVLAPGLITGGTQIDASGNRPRYIPETEGSLSADFDLTNLLGRDAYVRLDAIYTGSFFIDNAEFNEVDAATRLNLRAGVQINDIFSAELFGINITDNRNLGTNGGTTSDGIDRKIFATPVRGAEWGVRLRAEF